MGGNLYIKKAIISALIHKTLPKRFEYLSLRNITLLKFQIAKTQNTFSNKKKLTCNLFFCPLTLLEMNGSFSFVASYSTGYTFSNKAIKQLPKIVEEIVDLEIFDEKWIVVCPNKNQQNIIRLEILAEKI